MADRFVTHVWRDTKGVIRFIANPEADWFHRRRQWAINDIEAGQHDYFVVGSRGAPTPIDVVQGPAGAYLRSRADPITSNNLDDLPEYDLRPWETVNSDAEVLAVHAALVPHGPEGQVLLFGGNEHDPGNAEDGEVFNTRLYDVATNSVLEIGSPPADVFCCGHAFLPNGRLLVGGGTADWRTPHPAPPFDEGEDEEGNPHEEPHEHWSGARDCAVYNVDGTWTEAAHLQQAPPPQAGGGGGRWYPTLVTLGDGRILAVGGHPLLGDLRHGTWLPELYDPASDTWAYAGLDGHWLYVRWNELDEELTPPPPTQPETTFRTERRNNYLYYPRLFVVPGDRVFMASPNEGACGWYDPAPGRLDEPAVDAPAVGAPAHGAAFSETNHTAVLLPLLPGDGYMPRVLFLGNQGPWRITLDRSDPSSPLSWEETVPRDWPGSAPLRRHSCSVLLPTGDVIFIGGIDNAGGSGLPDSDAVLEAEVYRPGIDWANNIYDFQDEEWTTTPPATVVRNYHSVALLLPNGRVLTAGSNIDGSSGGDSVKEYRIEIYSPSYDEDTNRPQILDAPGTIAYGSIFSIAATRADRIARVALMRCGSVTHAWDGDQRYVALEFTNPSDTAIEATAPPDGGVAPPGPYMLWVVDDRGRPCRLAPFVLVT